METQTPHELDTQLGKGWEQTMYDCYYMGGSDHEVARELRVTMALFEKFYKGYEIFKELVDKGRSDARGFYENLGRKHLLKQNGDLNDKVWFLTMKNRFNWSDKGADESNLPPAATLDNNTLEQKIAQLQAKARATSSTRVVD